MELPSNNQKYQEYHSPYSFLEEPKSLRDKEKKYPLGFQIFDENKENKILLATKNLTNKIEEHKPDHLGKPKNKSIKIDEIDKLSDFEKKIASIVHTLANSWNKILETFYVITTEIVN